MKKRYWLIILAFLLSFVLLGCEKKTTTKKSSVPVYQGMTVDRVVGDSHKNASALKLNINQDGEEPDIDNHDDHSDELENNIEDLVKIDVITDGEVKYYVQPNETFIIEVHIFNPNDFEIQSFTLNGKKYANYMFKDGSTMELLLLEVTAPSTSGYYEYTIDAIKYIDGTEIKDVDMSSGNKSIKTGIAYNNGPLANLLSGSIFENGFNLNLSIVDQYSLLKDNFLSIFLSDGKDIIESKELKVGNNELSFNNLKMATTYEYGVAAVFDLADGRDKHVDWLIKNYIKTSGPFEINNIVVDKTSISFSINNHGVGKIEGVSLYDSINKRVVEVGDENTTSFTNLLSNHEYNLYVDYSYEIAGVKVLDWTGQKNIKTEEMIVPNLSFNNPTVTKTSISYSTEVVDPDDLLNVTKVELIKGTELVKDNDNELSGSFTELLSNNLYTVKVSYTYDLNDGLGTKEESKTIEVTTIAKEVPLVTFGEPEVTKTSISYTISKTDLDNILTIEKVELFRNEELVKTNDNELTGSFENLLSNNEFVIKVSYSYDLNDGNGVIDKASTCKVKTTSMTTPLLSISNEIIEIDTYNGTLDILDEDNICTINSVQIYKNEELVANNELLNVSFDSLDAYTIYDVKVSYSYDLNDGKGIINDTFIKELKTKPIFELTSFKIANTSAVSEGDTIYLQMTLNNPSKAVPKTALISNHLYNFVKTNSNSIGFIEIIVDSQFIGGNTELVIQKINYELDNRVYEKDVNENNVCSIFINGKLKLIDSYWVDSNIERKELPYYYFNEQPILLLNILNPTEYDVDEIEIKWPNDPLPVAKKVVAFNDNKYLLYISQAEKESMASYFICNKISIKKIICKKNEVTKEEPLDEDFLVDFMYIVKNDAPIEIKSITDFVNMEDGYCYKLMNNLDLNGYEWLGKEFKGVLLGCGYSINNMSFVGALNNTEYKVGLFSQFEGVISNIKIKDSTYVVYSNANWFRFGFVSGFCYDAVIVDCVVDQTCIATISIQQEDAICWSAGIVGYSDGQTTLNGCLNYSNIDVDGGYYVAGLIGYSESQILNIINCSNYGNISSYSNTSLENCGAAGIISCIDNTEDQFSKIEFCNNYGQITGQRASGIAIAGANEVLSCINYGEVSDGVENFQCSGIVYWGSNCLIKDCENKIDFLNKDAHIDPLTGELPEEYRIYEIVFSTRKTVIENCIDSIGDSHNYRSQ